VTTYSLRFRLTALTGLLAFLLLLLAWVLVGILSSRYTHRHKRAVLLAVARELVEEMEPMETADSDFPEMIEEIYEAIRMTSERLVVIHLRDGQPVRRSHPGEPSWPLPSGDDWLVSIIPYHGDQLVIALYYKNSKESLKNQAILLGLLAGCCFLVVTGSTWYLVGKVLAPIPRLSKQARAAESDLKTRLAVPSSDTELVELVSTLNQFLDRLARSTEMRSRFYSAASHELRTPLQALSGHLELALNKQRSAEEYREALEEAQGQTYRLIRLTRDLLLLNRLETASQIEKQELDLADLCENAWSALARQAEARQLKVDMEFQEGCFVHSNPSYLDSLCRNLLENAVKYTPTGGEVVIRVSTDGLTVCNDSAPLAPEDLEKLCEPFFRPDHARSGFSGGNGLGLPLVAAIVEHEGWHLKLSQADGRFEAAVKFNPPG